MNGQPKKEQVKPFFTARYKNNSMKPHSWLTNILGDTLSS